MFHWDQLDYNKNMKRKHFYSHLVEETHITLEIGELEVTNTQRVHLLSLMKANIHSTVVSTVLSNLSTEDKKIFLKNLSLENNEKIWAHLKNNIIDVEEKLKKIIDETIKELIEDVRQARKLKKN